MEKLEMLVFVHYNLRLRVRGLTVRASNDPEYCPIDLNHIFNDQDILDPWIVESEKPLLDKGDNQWLDDGLKDFATAKGRRKQEENAQLSGSGAKPSYTVSEPSSSSSSSNNGGGGNDEVHSGNFGAVDASQGNRSNDNDSSNDAQKVWEKGYDAYYATQDTDHGYRPGIDARRGHLARLTSFTSQSSSDEHDRHSTGTFPDNWMGGQYGAQQVPPYNEYPYHWAPPLPRLPPPSPNVPQPPAHWSRHREESTSTSSGGYYDHREGSGSQMQRDRGGSESSSSFGPTGQGYEHGWISATPSLSYGRDPSFSTQDNSSQSESQTDNHAQDYGSNLATSLFSYPQAQFYDQSSFGFQPHRHSYGS